MTDREDNRPDMLDAAAQWYIALKEEPDDANARAKFEDWLRASPEHAEAWAAMGQTVDAIRRIPPELRPQASPASVRFRRRASGRASRKVDTSNATTHRRWRAAAALVAACLVVMAAPSIHLRLTADHLTGTADVERIALPDGSKVVLGPDSAIRLRFSDTQRHVELVSGQAVFDVRPDKARPFEVASADVTTRVLGTRFDVRMLPNRVRVGVDHGRVRVRANKARATLPDALVAGDWLEIGSDGHLASGRQDEALVGAWQDGKAFVRNRSIADVIDEIRPWYRGRIVLMDTDIGKKPVTGIYDFSRPADAIGLLVNPYGGRVIQLSPWLILVRG